MNHQEKKKILIIALFSTVQIICLQFMVNILSLEFESVDPGSQNSALGT